MSNAHMPSILITAHPAHEAIIRELRSKGKFRVIVLGGPDFQPFLSAAAASVRVQRQKFVVQIQESLRGLLGSSIFHFSGRDFSPELCTRLEALFLQYLDPLLLWAEAFELCHHAHTINAVVLHEDVTPLMRLFIALAEYQGIPTIHLPHGLELNRLALRDFDDLIRTTMVAASGPHSRDWYLANPRNHPANIELTGRPEWDELTQKPLPTKDVARRLAGLMTEQPVLGFAASWAHELTTFDSDARLEESFRAFLRAVRHLGAQAPEIILRLHPGHAHTGKFDARWHYRIAAEEGVPISILNVSKEIFLAASDAIAAFDSTFIAEALLAKRLALSIAWPQPGMGGESGYHGLPAILTCSPETDAIATAIRRLLYDSNLKDELIAGRTATIERLNTGHDGKATSRFITLIERLTMGMSPGPNNYYQHSRPEIQALIPVESKRILDVGCAVGALGRAVKERQECLVTGIEYVPEVAQEARKYLDEVYTGDATTTMASLPANSFDCIIFADVLEHLVDPGGCLVEAKRLLAPGGTVIASIPNVRHWSVLKSLLEGHWDYQDAGILDRTHLRFFTRESMIRMFQESGFHVNALAATVTPGVGSPDGLAEMLVRMGIDASTLEDEGRVFQFLLTATPVASLVVPDRSEKRVSIVIPLFNKVDFSQRCLEALVENTPPDLFEVIVVDNASSDGTAELLACLEGDVQIIRNPRNMGFARACNQGAQAATGKYVVFLNNDTLPQPGWLEALLEEVEHDPEVGIVGCKLLYPDTGKIQHAGIGWINGLPDHPYRHADPDAIEVNQARDLDMVTGACLLIRRNLFHEVGGFDEGYLNGVEDIDLCLQVRRAGYRVRYAPKGVLFHFEGTSEGRFDHVTPNLQRFFTRWHGCFTPDGRFVPPPKPLPVRWEGTQFVYHSLAHVNRELTRQLIASAALDLAVIPYEPHQFNADALPALRPIEQRIARNLPESARVHVRHQWPPKFEPPSEGAWVMIQPWEFGGIPQEWIAPMRDQVDEIWVPTSWVRDCYIRSGIPTEKVVVVPNGVNTELYHPEGVRFPLQTRKRFKFLFLGGAIARKGIDILLETYVNTFSKQDDVCLVIKTNGANGHYRGASLDDEIRRLSAHPDAPDIEYIEQDLSDAEIASLYRACDALVHPYRGEGFGMPIAEAMASALPVIVTGYGACLDFCDAESAYLIPATIVDLEEHSLPAPSIGYWLADPDRTALARLMREVMQNPHDAKFIGTRARERIVTEFQWSQVTQIVIERISELADRVPIRFAERDPFSPERTPIHLEERRDVAFFHQLKWPDDSWKKIVRAYSRAFSASDDVSLVLWLDPVQGLDVEEVGECLMEVLASNGSDPEQSPDILLLSDALDIDGLAGLYAAADSIVPAGDQEQAARATRMKIPVLTSLDISAWHDMVEVVRSKRVTSRLNSTQILPM